MLTTQGAAAGRPQVMSVLGGRMTPVVMTLMIVNTAIFIVLSNLAASNPAACVRIVATFGIVPRALFGEMKLWQLVTSLFLHVELQHLLSNMIWLWLFGCVVERQWKKSEFIGYYLLSGVGASLLSFAVHPSSPIPCIGASGAIFGLMAAFAVLYGTMEFFFVGMFKIRGKTLVAAAVALELLAIVSNTQDGIGHAAHLGGAVAGYLYLMLQRRLSRGGPAAPPGGAAPPDRFKNLEFFEE